MVRTGEGCVVQTFHELLIGASPQYIYRKVGMRLRDRLFSQSPCYVIAAIGVVPHGPLGLVFRDYCHCFPHLGIDMRGILPSLEEEGSVVSSRSPARPHLGQYPTIGKNR